MAVYIIASIIQGLLCLVGRIFGENYSLFLVAASDGVIANGIACLNLKNLK